MRSLRHAPEGRSAQASSGSRAALYTRATTVLRPRPASGVVVVNGGDLGRPEIEPFARCSARAEQANTLCVGVEPGPGIILVEVVHQRTDHHACLRPVALSD